ncbi:hypothetical protein L0657_21975 [Dyadobacter sp. CY345]|uniref:hypothetical protein n=1 Tax=Dyadobacter sp. CY345 TaxID=2909335 RepID=UPI001F37FA7E|nr:hypothetical protein [Dyadobacter sp. CY345]MCF2446641.1 hypothetical protein [Dyadobacter sp. CY345]
METTYQIVVQMKALNGILEIGRFLLSTDKEFAFETFNSLKGKTKLPETQVLRLSLLETTGLSGNIIGILGCNLDELSENCKIITRDAFKFFNLGII